MTFARIEWKMTVLSCCVRLSWKIRCLWSKFGLVLILLFIMIHWLIFAPGRVPGPKNIIEQKNEKCGPTQKVLFSLLGMREACVQSSDLNRITELTFFWLLHRFVTNFNAFLDWRYCDNKRHNLRNSGNLRNYRPLLPQENPSRIR